MSHKTPTKYLRLRYAMHSRGYTQQRLCDEFNNLAEKTKTAIYQTELSAWLSGVRPFRIDVAWAIMKILGLPPEDFYWYFPPDGEDGIDSLGDVRDAR